MIAIKFGKRATSLTSPIFAMRAGTMLAAVLTFAGCAGQDAPQYQTWSSGTGSSSQSNGPPPSVEPYAPPEPTSPLGPTVAVMPNQGKPFDAFQADQTLCRRFAEILTSDEAASSDGTQLQQRYDLAYSQCMYSRGDQVPAYQSQYSATSPSGAPSPPVPQEQPGYCNTAGPRTGDIISEPCDVAQPTPSPAPSYTPSPSSPAPSYTPDNSSPQPANEPAPLTPEQTKILNLAKAAALEAGFQCTGQAAVAVIRNRMPHAVQCFAKVWTETMWHNVDVDDLQRAICSNPDILQRVHISPEKERDIVKEVGCA